MQFFSQNWWYGNTGQDFLIWTGVIMGAYLSGKLVSTFFSWNHVVIRFLKRCIPFSLLALALALAMSNLSLPVRFASWARMILFITVVFKVTLELQRILSFGVDRRLAQIQDASNNFAKALLPSLLRLGHILIWAIAIILIISHLGYDVSSLVAGLGIGGIALALAAQEALSNFIASISILSDAPFQVGDLVKVQNHTGTVKEIGLRSTRIKTADKTMVSIPNKLMAETIVENISTRNMYKVEQVLEFPFDSSEKNFTNFLKALRIHLNQEPHVDPGTSRVHFVGFGAMGLQVKIFYYITDTSELVKTLDIQESISLKIKALAKQMKLHLLSTLPHANSKS